MERPVSDQADRYLSGGQRGLALKSAPPRPGRPRKTEFPRHRAVFHHFSRRSEGEAHKGITALPAVPRGAEDNRSSQIQEVASRKGWDCLAHTGFWQIAHDDDARAKDVPRQRTLWVQD